MAFSDEKYEEVGFFANVYFEHVAKTTASVVRVTLVQAANVLEQTYQKIRHSKFAAMVDRRPYRGPFCVIRQSWFKPIPIYGPGCQHGRKYAHADSHL
jgi:hypothetical protein